MQISSKKNWKINDLIPEKVSENLKNYDPILQQLLFNRAITTAEQADQFLNKSGALYSPFQLKGMNEGVDSLIHAIDENQEIAVYGDYDVDGVTATALLVQLLRAYGAKCRGYIPNRFEEGYGVNKDALENLYQEGIRTIITVDCGIRSPGEAEFAREKGITLIISDHHEPESELPNAPAVICPKQPGDTYPEKNLAGVGLAYKIAQAMLETRPLDGVQADQWLDLVAIGTVADVVSLTGENRSLVMAGLNTLKDCKRVGLVSLLATAELDPALINTRDIGFVIGPRLNAAGRLQSALDAFDLLIQEDISRAGLLAQKLDDQNRQRQELTRKMQEEAESQAAGMDGDELIFAAHEDFNMGVVGLVASRLTDQYYRPAIVAYLGPDYARGSCRSIPEFHITRALDQCSSLLVRHGGHAMAAGFTVLNENLQPLKDRLKEIARAELQGKDLQPVLQADLEIPLSQLNRQVFDLQAFLEPTGLGNPGVTFVSRNVTILNLGAVGAQKQHLRLKVKGEGIVFDAIAFRQGYRLEEFQINDPVDLLFSFEKNNFRGQETYQLNVRDIKAASQPE